MIYFTDSEIDNLITEDVPHYDITTSLLRLGSQLAKIQFSTRHETVVCGIEEVLKIFSKFNITPTLISPSGDHLEKKVKFLEAEGLAKHIHLVWRSSTNLMEYASGIATRTKMLVDKVRTINSEVEIATTRKTIPYTRKIATKAVKSGGGSIHRLGLSESVMIYNNHYKFIGGFDGLKSRIEQIHNQIHGKTITVEVKNEEDAFALIDAKMDVLQLDKLSPDVLKTLIPKLKKKNPTVKIAVTGGINIDNCADFARTGANILVTSWPYYAHPADFNVNIEPIYDF